MLLEVGLSRRGDLLLGYGRNWIEAYDAAWVDWINPDKAARTKASERFHHFTGKIDVCINKADARGKWTKGHWFPLRERLLRP